MSGGNQQPTPSLTEWLNTATEKLSAPAQERIKLEISSHFEDALEAKLAEGLSEADAQAKVLADLGDAQSAARRFRREHLTDGDVKIIKGNLSLIKDKARHFILLICSCVLGADIADNGRQQFGRHNPGYLLVTIVALFSLSIGSTYHFFPKGKKLSFADPKKRRPSISALLRASSILDFTYIAAVCLVFGFTWAGFFICSPLLLSKLVRGRTEIRLWLKLRRMADVWQEMPPPGATAS